MPFNLLLFPLAGGYYLLVQSHFLKYYHQRVERQRLIFNSVVVGIILLFVAFICTYIAVKIAPELVGRISAYSPVRLPFFWTTLFSFVLGVAFAHMPNWVIGVDRRQRCIVSAIQNIGNELEKLLETSHSSGSLVMLTLGSDKVYAGWVKSLPIPNRTDYVEVFPIYSGYRDKNTKTLTFTTQYLDVYATYVKEGSEIGDIRTLTSLIIKVNEVITASHFDIEMYDRFNPAQSNT